MANRFWVAGGTGNWNDTSNWSTTTGGASGASVPGSSDIALLDASSGSGTVTLDISPDIQRLTCTGFTGTLDFGTNTISLNFTGTIFTGATTMTVTGTPLIICTSTTTTTTRTITPTAVTESNSISFRITAGTFTVTVASNSAVRNIDFTDGTNPTGFAGNLTNSNLTVYGDFKASTGMTRTAGTGTYTFAATSGTKTINTAGVTFDNPFIFNGVGGTFQLQAALTSGATRACTLTNGTLDLNGYTATFGSVSSSNTNVRTFAFGTTGKFVLLNSGVTVWTTSNSTNLTVTGTNPLIQLTTNATTGTRGIIFGAAGEANSISVDVTAGSDQINFSTTNGAYRNVDFTGFTGAVSLQNSILVFGDWNFGGATSLGSGTGTVGFAATSGTKTITSNGLAFPGNANFSGVGGAWSLQDAFAINSGSTITFTNGSIITNGYAVTAGVFSSSNANTRSLNLGASTVTITGSGGTPWNFLDTTNLTFTAGTSAITTTGTAGTITFNGGGLTYYNVTFGATYYNTSLTGANTFNDLTVASPAGVGRRNVNVEGTQTINGTLTAVGSAANSRSRFSGEYTGTTITAAAVSLADTDFGNIIAAGASSPWSGTRLGDFGYNTNITFASPKTVYWNQPAGGNWSDVAWATSSGGAVNVNNFPLGQDTAVLDDTGVGASTTIVMDYGWILGSLSAGSLTNALTINWNTFGALAASSQGNFTLSSAITLTYTQGSLGFASSQSSTAIITTAGVVIPMPSANFNAASKTIQFADNFTSTGTSVGLVAGTLDLNGNTLSCNIFDSTFTDLEVRVLAFNGGQIDVTGNSATVWACENLTNFSYTGTPTVNFTYSGSVGIRTINNGATGATESNVVDFNVTAGTDTWSATTPNSVRNLNFTGFSGTTGLFGGGFIYGNLTLSSTQTVTASALVTTFAATSGTKTITTNGVTIDRQLTFNGVGGTWTLQDALTLGSTRKLEFVNGTFNTGNYTVTCGQWYYDYLTVNGAFTLNLGSSTINLIGSLYTIPWQMGGGFASPLVVNGGTSNIVFNTTVAQASMNANAFFATATYYKVTQAGTNELLLNDGFTLITLQNTAQPTTITFRESATSTLPFIIDNFNVSGTAGNLVTIKSKTPGSQFSIAKNTGGKVLVSYCSISDSNVTPAGYWFAPTSQGNVDGGNNTGWNFGAAGGAGGFLPFF